MTELLPVSIGIGLVVSLFLSEVFGIAGAGMVVPGYIALHLTEPLTVSLTLGTGVATFALVRALSSILIIYGRRRTVMMILLGYLMGMAARYAIGEFTGWELTEEIDYSIIGFIIPGLIAIWLDRRGLVESFCSLITASVIVRLVLGLVYGARLTL